MSMTRTTGGETEPTPQKQKVIKTLIEKKIDEFNENTFPASDPPNWSSLQHLRNESLRESPPKQEGAPHSDFTLDIEQIRKNAIQHIENGAVTANYGCDINTTLRLLNEALATEIVCVLRYSLHYQMASGMDSQPVAEEFLEHAQQEQKHVDLIAARITQLNGEPNFDPCGLDERAQTSYVRCNKLMDMIEENLIAERMAIDIYTQLISYFGERDPVTRRLLEDILRDEEEHAEDLKNLLPSP